MAQTTTPDVSVTWLATHPVPDTRVDVIVVGAGSLEYELVVDALLRSHRDTRVLPPAGMRDFLLHLEGHPEGSDWWRSRARMRDATRGEQGLRAVKYVAAALRTGFRWPFIEATDEPSDSAFIGLAERSPVRDEGYRWDIGDDERRAALLRAVQKFGETYVGTYFRFRLASSRRRVDSDVLDTLRRDLEWLRERFPGTDVEFP